MNNEDQWSMDLATLMRLDNALQRLNSCHSETDIIGVRLWLKVLRLEVLPHLDPKQREEEKELWELIKGAQIGYNIDNDLYMQEDLLDLYEIYESFLRQMLMDHQLLMKKGQTWIQKLRS